jgi:DNA-binding HxlR family transcriptional regulator
METPRSYGDSCGIAHGLDLVGERWALLVVRELLLGPRRFTDLRTGLPGASANVLSQRLRELEQVGIVRRRKLAPPAGSWVYELTEWGGELEPMVIGLGTWALKSGGLDPAGALSVVSALLTLRTFFVAPLDDWRAVFELHFGDDRYTATVASGRVDIHPGSAIDADAVITSDPRTLVDLFGDDCLRVDDLIGSGRLALTGDVDAATRLFGAVRIPQAQPQLV